jgi:hypothetical protein
VDLRTAQLLAGHSSPVLTARSMRKRMGELVDGVNQLAGLLVPSPPGKVDCLQSPCSQLAVPAANPCGSVRTDEEMTPEIALSSLDPDPLQDKGIEDERGQLMTAEGRGG